MTNFRPKAPVVPRMRGTLVDVANDELRRATETTSKVEIVNGRMTDEVTLGTFGTTQRIAHKLGRMPTGWTLAYQGGYPPQYRIDDVDAKHITLTSLNQTDVCGYFVTDGAGAVILNVPGVLATAARTGVGVHRVTLAFDCTALLSAEAKSTSTSSAVETRFTTASFGGPNYVDFSTYTGAGIPLDLISLSCLFHIAVTGADSRLKFWVF